MSHYHSCVWIDHREARIFAIGLTGVDAQVVRDATPPRHIHRKADHLGLGKAPPDAEFFAEVAAALGPYKAIVIVGPGTARAEFAGYLAEHVPLLAKKVWGIEPMDHPTDAQIVAASRKYFRAADQLRS